MTPTAPAREFNEKSLVAVGATIGGLVVVTLICKAANIGQEVAGVVSGSAGLIPGAIAYGVQRRRSSIAVSTGTSAGWRPPAPALIAVLFGIVMYVVDSLLGILFTYRPTYPTVLFFLGLYYTLSGMGAGLLSFRILHKPYLWLVAVAVGVALTLRIFTMILFAADIAALDTYQYPGAAFTTVFYALLGYVIMFGVTAAGVAISTRFRAAYLARRLSGASLAPPVAPSTSAPMIAPSEPQVPTPTAGQTPPAPAAIAAPPVPAAGWFPDPHLRGIQRWWDGATWTDNRRNIPEVADQSADVGGPP